MANDCAEHHRFVNRRRGIGERDSFTLERYRQLARHIQKIDAWIFDVGWNTGRGGVVLKEILPNSTLTGLDIATDRPRALPPANNTGLLSSSDCMDVADCSYDAIVGGEFVEQCYPRDVDQAQSEFHRNLKNRRATSA